MTIRTRKTSAGYAVSWRYRGHRYQTLVSTRAKAKTVMLAIKAKLTPAEVVAKSCMLAPTALVLAGESKRNGREGGLARAARMPAVERSRIASLAAKARWAKKPAEVTP